MKTIAGRVSDETHKLLMEKCEELGLNQSQYITKLVHKDLGVESKVLKPEHQTGKGILSSLKKAFGVKTEPMNNCDMPSVKTHKAHHKRNKNSSKPDSIWIPPKVAKKEYKGELIHIGEKIRVIHTHTSKNSYNDLKATMSEVSIINEVYKSKNHFKIMDVNEFKKAFHLKASTLGKLLWNVKEGNFENLIATYKNEISNMDFALSDIGNFIEINGRTADISISVARDIVTIMQNANNHEVKIWELQQGYRYLDPYHVRVIGDNYDNPKLLNLLKDEPLIEVVNNPSKRRNLIMNGGGGVNYECNV